MINCVSGGFSKAVFYLAVSKWEAFYHPTISLGEFVLQTLYFTNTFKSLHLNGPRVLEALEFGISLLFVELVSREKQTISFEHTPCEGQF